MDFKFFFDHSKDALFLIDRSGKINSSNLVSQKHHLTEGKDLFSLLVPSERDKVTETVYNLIDNKSNETVLIELSCFPEMLSRSRWKISFIPELNQTAFCCEELSQYSPEDFLLHTGLMKIIFDNLNRLLEDKELWLPGTEETSDTSELKISEIELTTDPAGNATWFENIKVPIKMTFGEEVTLIISKNVTNWKMSEKRLVDHQQALFHSNRLSYLGEMAGQIAHEINNPLTIILGNSQIMKKSIKGEVSEENEMLLKSIQKIETMVERITKLIKMMRTLSKQNNILPQSKSKVFDLVSSVISTLNDKFNAYEIEITKNTNNLEKIEILCYPTEISQVILNILLNSIDAIILSKRTEARKIAVNLEQKKNEILIKITNNGDEISKDISDRIFEPFFTTKPVGHGTGLGLSISKRIIEQHQGNISFESSIEKTTFIITLPICD
jgi:signal transduction histidine kinase